MASLPDPGADARLTSRQREILAIAEAQGFVTIDTLAETFGVSAQTVRRDIIALDKAGLLQRFHGGAGPGGKGEALRLGHERKLTLGVDAKRRIAETAVAAIPDGAALFLDVGTTMEATAAVLNTRRGLQVFTNNLLAAVRLDHTRHEVHILGGRVSGKDGSLTGEEVVMGLSALSLDIALIGCSGVETGGRVMDFDFGKIAVKKTAMRVSKAAYLLAERTKFGRSARREIAPLTRFDQVISEDAGSINLRSDGLNLNADKLI